MDGSAAGAVVDGLEMRLVRRGGVPRPAAAAGVTHRAMAPLYDVTFAATASPPTTRHGGGGAADADSTAAASAPVNNVTYTLSWSATAVTVPAGGAAGRSAMPPNVAGSGARHSQRVAHGLTGLTGIGALQAMSSFSGNDLSTQLQTHGAVCGASWSCGAGSGGGGVDSESLRGAWRVAAGELQSTAVFSTVDVASTAAPRGGALSHDAAGVGGHGVAVSGNGLFSSSVRAVLSAATVGRRSPSSGGFQGFVAGMFLGLSPSAFEKKAPSPLAGTGALLTGGGGGLGTLMSSWLVHSAGHASVTILGRSGRSKQADAASTHNGAAVITIARCDVGATDEVHGVASSLTKIQVVLAATSSRRILNPRFMS